MELKDLIGQKVVSKKFGEGTVQFAANRNNFEILYKEKELRQGFPKGYPNFYQFVDKEADAYARSLARKSESIVSKMMKTEADAARHARLLKESKEYNPSGFLLDMPPFSEKAFIKFEGTDDNPDTIWMVNSVIDEDGERRFLLNFSNVGERIEENAEFFICKGNGENVYIYGRGIVTGFKSTNIAKDSWVKQHPWMKDPKTIKEGRMPRDKYVFVKECEVLATELTNCPTLMSVFKEYGGDVLDSKKGKNASLDELAKAHFQKSHVFLSEEGYVAMKNVFEAASKTFGTYKFVTKL